MTHRSGALLVRIVDAPLLDVNNVSVTIYEQQMTNAFDPASTAGA